MLTCTSWCWSVVGKDILEARRLVSLRMEDILNSQGGRMRVRLCNDNGQTRQAHLCDRGRKVVKSFAERNRELADSEHK